MKQTHIHTKMRSKAFYALLNVQIWLYNI